MLRRDDENREPDAPTAPPGRQAALPVPEAPALDELVLEAVRDLVRDLRTAGQLQAIEADAYLAKARLHPEPVRAHEQPWIDRLACVPGLASEDWTRTSTGDLLDRIYLGSALNHAIGYGPTPNREAVPSRS